MKIITNISPSCLVHDVLLYPPIEKQVVDYLRTEFGTDITHRLLGTEFVLHLNGFQCSLEIARKGVRLRAVLSGNEVHFGSGFYKDYPTLKLPYNKDIDDRIAKFGNTIRKLQALEGKAKDLLLTMPDQEVVQTFLNQELATDEVEVSYWHDNMFDGGEITFYLHPKGKAPADGVMVCFEKATQKITPYFSGERVQRLGEACHIEDAVGNSRGRLWDAPPDVPTMKAKIKAVAKVTAKIKAFRPKKSPEFMSLLDVKRQADLLFAEFKEIV